MPAIQPPGEVSASLAAQPLVTSATPVVTPSAVAAMADAFRNGFLTTEDIISRIGAVGQAKKKAELTLATEVASPDAVAARTQGYQAQAAQAKLQGAQATAGLPLVQPSANLAGQEIAAKTSLLPAQTALTAKQLELNSQFMFPKALYDIATERLKVVNTTKQVDPSSGAEYTRQFNAAGEDVTPGSEANATYSRIAQNAFASLNKGQPQVSPNVSAPVAQPSVSPAPSLAEPGFAPVSEAAPVDQQRADLLKSGKYDMHEVNALTDADVVQTHKALVRFLGAAPASPGQAMVTPNTPAPTVEPITPPATPAAPVIQPKIGYTPGLGIQSGMKSTKDRSLVPAEGVEKLALASQAKSTADRLQKAYADLIESDPQFTGLINGTITKAIAGKRWNDKVAAFEREATAILAPVAKGTYNETGVLSDKDVERYKNVLPDLRDTPRVGNEKMKRLIDEVNSAFANKISMWKQAGYDVGTLGANQPAAGGNSPTPAAAPQGKTVTIPGLGTGTVDANGIFTRTQ